MSEISLTYAGFGIFGAGILLGLTGGGGSILAIPILTLAGMNSAEAVVYSLLIVGIASFGGAFEAWLDGKLDLKAALMFMPPSMTGAALGGKLGSEFPDSMRLAIFGTAAGYASFKMFSAPSSSATNRKKWFLPGAFGVGILTGIAGVGGGFLAVPVLMSLNSLPAHIASSTSLLIIGMNSTAGLFGWMQTLTPLLHPSIELILLCLLGAFTGRMLAGKIPETILRKLLAILLAMASLITFIQIIQL